MYDLEPHGNQTRFEDAVIVYMQCSSHGNARMNLDKRYHMAAAWRAQYLETKLPRFKECLLAFIWANTSSVLRQQSPMSRGTNQFYIPETIMPSQVINFGEEDLVNAAGGAGGTLGSAVGASRPGGAEEKPRPMVDVIQGDMIATVWAAAKRGLRVLFLNMSNHSLAGGGVQRGACCQEEELFRCTDIKLHTNTLGQWPLVSDDCAGVLSRGVRLIRTGEEFGYAFLPGSQRPTFDVWSTTVPNLRQRKLKIAEAQVTQKRIDSIIKLGAKYELCILSAIGCGAFGHDPDSIADKFTTALMEHGGGGRFLFAIRPTPSDVASGRKEAYTSFKVLETEKGSEPAVSPSGSGGDVDQTQTLTQIILELPLHVDSSDLVILLEQFSFGVNM